MIKALEKHKRDIAKSRDALRDIEDEIKGLRYTADRGIEALEEAIEALSEQV